MSRAATADLTPALTLAYAMLDAAQAGDWDQVAELEQAREACIAGCFAATGPVAATDGFAAVVRDLLSVEHQVLALAQQRLAELGEHLSGIQRGRHAQLAYGAVAGAWAGAAARCGG